MGNGKYVEFALSGQGPNAPEPYFPSRKPKPFNILASPVALGLYHVTTLSPSLECQGSVSGGGEPEDAPLPLLRHGAWNMFEERRGGMSEYAGVRGAQAFGRGSQGHGLSYLLRRCLPPVSSSGTRYAIRDAQCAEKGGSRNERMRWNAVGAGVRAWLARAFCVAPVALAPCRGLLLRDDELCLSQPLKTSWRAC
eukprot:scaffold108057_cov37-Tisochrysis_lutea.AAC.1